MSAPGDAAPQASDFEWLFRRDLDLPARARRAVADDDALNGLSSDGYEAPPAAPTARRAAPPEPDEAVPALAHGGAQPDDGIPAAPSVEAKKPKKTISRPRRVVKWTAIVLAALLAVAVGVGGYYLKRAATALGNVSGNDCGLACAINAAGGMAGINQPSVQLKADANGRTNILMLGTSDDRWDGEGGQWLTDSIMILSISATQHDAYMMSIPRDLWIQYPKVCWVGYQGKINALYMCQGADDPHNVAKDRAALKSSMPVFEQVTGLDIQYALNINYQVLTGLVNAVGGTIPVTINSDDPRGIYDRVTGIKLPNGTSRIDAVQTLNLARARNSEGGYGLSNSNFGREKNQQAILKGLVQQAESNGFFTNMSGMTTLFDALGSNLRSTFSPDEIVAAMYLAKDIPAGNFHSISLIDAKPAVITTGMVNEQSVVMPVSGLYNYSGIHKYVAKSLGPATVASEAATIDVLNASKTVGLGSSQATSLKNAGFTVGYVGNYTGTNPGSVKVYQLSQNSPVTAAALAKKLGVTVIQGSVPSYTSKDNAEFVVLVGGA